MIRYFTILLLFLTTNFFSQKHILIGDSQTFLLSKHSNLFQQEKSLCKVGIGINYLIERIQTQNIHNEVKSIILIIGANDRYIFSKPKSEHLFYLIRNRYPNAKIFYIKGSWGWGNIKNVNEKIVEAYSKKMEDFGCVIIQKSIGKGNPHKDKTDYQIIANMLEKEILKINE